MATSAQERFDRLFEGQEMPERPTIDALSPRHSGGGTTPAARAQPIPRNGDPSTNLDEAALKIPQMKIAKERTKRRLPPDAGAHDYPIDLQREPLIPLQYLPMSKDSLDMQASKGTNDEDASENESLPTEDAFGNRSTGHFCVFHLVAKFPYKYMVDGNDQVSRHFFASNKFNDRTWDLYYIDPPASLVAKPILLLPYDQVEKLISNIGKTFKVDVAIPPEPFTMSFFDDGTPQPKHLGITTSRYDIAELQDSIPSATLDHGEPPKNLTPNFKYSFEAFKAKCHKAIVANKKKAVAVKRKKQNHRLLQARDWVKQLKRAQQYIGIRPKSLKPQEPDLNLSWAEQEAFRIEQEDKCHMTLEPFKVNSITPYAFHKNPVIVSIDVESYERAHHLITEVGISTIDTLDLTNIAPGQGGQNWMKQIRSRHFRIKEYMMLINKDFCPGNPDNFKFGASEIVKLADAPAAVDSCFERPFSAAYKHDGIFEGMEEFEAEKAKDMAKVDTHGPSRADHEQANKAVEESLLGHQSLITPTTSQKVKETDDKPTSEAARRNILLLGHDLPADLAYLEQLGSLIFQPDQSTAYLPVPTLSLDPEKRKYAEIQESIVEALDTAVLYRVLKGENQNRKLTTILSELGRCAWFAHNAGNDARYTMEAFIAMVVKARLLDDHVKAERKAALAKSGGGDLATAVSDNHSSTNMDNGRNTSSPSSNWKREKARRIAEKIEQARIEAEDECRVWEQASSPGTQSSSPLKLDETREQADGECLSHTTSSGVNSRGVFATSLPLSPKSSRKPTLHDATLAGEDTPPAFRDHLNSLSNTADDRGDRNAEQWAAHRQREAEAEARRQTEANKEWNSDEDPY